MISQTPSLLLSILLAAIAANIWITDMANFAEMNAVWDAWVSPGNTPARATVEAKLASPDYKVEIMVVAAR
jgi:enamine deaminase RidA (YjgF/YER057c/UK114 family)